MEEEFTLTTGAKIFNGIFSFITAVGAIFFLLMGFTRNPAALLGGVALLPLAVLFGAQFSKKIIISADRIVGTNILQTREIPTSSVKGYRIGLKTIVIKPDSPAYSKIIINDFYDFGDYKELLSWLKENFKNLDKADMET